MKRLAFTIIFLALTFTVLIFEFVYAFDGSDNTRPWTDLIVSYVSWELALAGFGALLLWVPLHFYVRYRRKHRKE